MTRPTTQTATRRGLSLRRCVPYLLLALGCQLSLGAVWFVSSTEQTQAQAAFIANVQETRQRIQGGLNTSVEVVRAGTALLAASHEINASEFRAFVAGLELNERYRGLAGIGFSPRVRHRDLRSFSRAIRLDGVRRFRIWPETTQPEHQPVIFVEPRVDRRPVLIGFDMATDPVLRAAMDRARDTGQPVASATLQDMRPFAGFGRPDFVLYIPVYRVGAASHTIEDRRRALIGLVFSPFRLAELLPHVLKGTTPAVGFEFFDGTIGQPAALIYRSTAHVGAARFITTESIRVAGREWRITMRSLEEPVGVVSAGAQRTFAVGVLLSLLLFVITHGQVRAWETAARHETELRASEEALRGSERQLQETVMRERQARAQAEAADRAKDEFLATLSHELRTPLNTVLGWLTMLRTKSMRESQREHALDVIARNARLQAQLIEDLLDVSRIVMGKTRLVPQPLVVNPIVCAVLESIRPAAEAKGVTLHALIAPDTGKIWGDSSRVQQIVWNILSNAVKFTSAGGQVSVELTRHDRHVQLDVRDTGVGIPPSFLPYVFERFRQADCSTTRTHGGVGLGLAIVRDLVELHGGSIEAHSEGTNRGATFVVRLPVLPASLDVASRDVDVLASPLLNGVRVLVVDDDAETRELLSRALAMNGAGVTTAGSAREAFEQLKTGAADVLISDIGMPEEDGLSLMRRVRTLAGEPGHIPAIALTAYARASDHADAMEAGYQMYFAKPVELVALQAALVTLTGRRDA